tara:strand:- start:96 stop:728 length:633 start_codon:yes stop_codon:yes gene_type:complete
VVAIVDDVAPTQEDGKSARKAKEGTFLKYSLDVAIRNFQIRLIESNTSPTSSSSSSSSSLVLDTTSQKSAQTATGNELCRLQCSSMQLKVHLRNESETVEADIGKITVKDFYTAGSCFPVILQTMDSNNNDGDDKKKNGDVKAATLIVSRYDKGSSMGNVKRELVSSFPNINSACQNCQPQRSSFLYSSFPSSLNIILCYLAVTKNCDIV